MEWQSLTLTQAPTTLMAVKQEDDEYTVTATMAIATTSYTVVDHSLLSSNEVVAAWTMASREPRKSGR